MATNEADRRYSGAAIALHWLTAVLIVANLLLGLSMVPLPITPRKLYLYAYHKWIGITVFLLTCLRLAWRATHPAPPAVAMPEWQRQSALASHVLLYLRLVPLPDLVPDDKALALLLKQVHISLNFALFLLVCLHSAAALKHHFMD